MLDTKNMTVGEIRSILVDRYSLSQEEADSLSPKSVASAKLLELAGDDELLENAVEDDWTRVGPVSDQDVVEEEPVSKVYSIQDEGWNDYVLSLLRPNEIIEGAPRIFGLRRLVELLIGPIDSCTSKVLQCPDNENNHTATVRVRVCVGSMVMDGCANAGKNNVPQAFARHAVSVAESIAESKAYRKLLRLSVISAEEITKDEDIVDFGEKIQEHQINFMDSQSKKINMNVLKWLESKNVKCKVVDDIPRAKSLELMADLNGIVATRSVPENLIGYVENWRNLS